VNCPNAVAGHVAECRNFLDAARWKEKGDPVVEELGLHRAGLINGHVICEVYLQVRRTAQFLYMSFEILSNRWFFI
jgi:hypothetical protein